MNSKWTTIAIVGFSAPVARYENRSSHGAICKLQARKGKNGILGRKVNSNGRHEEIGDSFPLDSETLARWKLIGKM